MTDLYIIETILGVFYFSFFLSQIKTSNIYEMFGNVDHQLGVEEAIDFVFWL
jgi:hypothetical protein